MMEFMINNLLIEGQVENYVLVMNLEAASFSYRNVKIYANLGHSEDFIVHFQCL